MKLGDWWWWVLDVKERGKPDESGPPLPRRALLLSEGLVDIRPYMGNVDENGQSDFPDHDRWDSLESGALPGALWSDSALRKWLKEVFFPSLPPDVVSRVVPESIATPTAWASQSVWREKVTGESRVKGLQGDPTNDSIYVLGPDDVLGEQSEYSFGDADVDARTVGGLTAFWWLRSPGDHPNRAWAVLPPPLFTPERPNFLWAGRRAGVRPVFWLNLES